MLNILCKGILPFSRELNWLCHQLCIIRVEGIQVNLPMNQRGYKKTPQVHVGCSELA